MGNDEPKDAPHWSEGLRHRGELLFEFTRHGDGARFRCELIDHGDVGCEVQFYRNGEFGLSRMFTGRLGSRSQARERALDWAAEYRRRFQGETG
jgi:hypothetical protein